MKGARAHEIQWMMNMDRIAEKNFCQEFHDVFPKWNP